MGLGDDFVRRFVVDQLQAELLVQLGLVRGLRISERGEDPSERLGQVLDLLAGEPVGCAARGQEQGETGLGGLALGGHLVDPSEDGLGGAAGLEGVAVDGELAVAVGDEPTKRL
ncbi:hypothetical protein BL253_36365 [Pseudofrankia asymbiotica]|uniref:Uncharacterized protein n=1 Tax=Pseudofrankia asymbiotica TaxID=1834516 RepID=A0A1V2HZF2_9ACTN|nr:hypothetical protein BL253_36365 [Pseudofrankia asymbiotica]